MNSTEYKSPPCTRKERDVWEACDKLVELKKPITYFAITEQLVIMGYKRGSQADIHRYIKTWRNHQPMPQQEIIIPRICSNLSEEEAPYMAKDTANDDLCIALQLARFYEHHLQQFDRLIRIIEILKKENNMLRNIIRRKGESNQSEELPPTSYTKPRVTCKSI